MLVQLLEEPNEKRIYTQYMRGQQLIEIQTWIKLFEIYSSKIGYDIIISLTMYY